MAATHSVTLGIIEHHAEDCPALFPDKAEVFLPVLRAAAAKGKLPQTLVFSSKDHKGAFLWAGPAADVMAALPELPLHKVRLYDATNDEVAERHLASPRELQKDEASRREFLTYLEKQFQVPFPKRNDGPVPSGAELADFIASNHE